MLKKLGTSLVLITCIIFMINGVVLAATGMDYYVVAYDNSSGGKTAYGTDGNNYVMSNPTVSSVDGHVSSLYVRDGGGVGNNFAEVGWCAHNYLTGRSVQFFVAAMKNGAYKKYHEGDAPLGTNHFYKIEHVGSGNWDWYIDGVKKWTTTFSGFTYGYTTASSERETLNDTNYSHFWMLYKKDNYNVWSTWSNLTQLLDNDPNYNLRKVTNYECYMEIP